MNKNTFISIFMGIILFALLSMIVYPRFSMNLSTPSPIITKKAKIENNALPSRDNYKFSVFKNFVLDNYHIKNTKETIRILKYVYFDMDTFYTKINKIRKNNNLPIIKKDKLKLLMVSWIYTESTFNPNAISNSECYGLLQIKYKTWKPIFNIRKKENLYNYKYNLNLASNIFIKYLNNNHGKIYPTFIDYNAGPFAQYTIKKRSVYAKKIMHLTDRVFKNYMYF